VTRSQRLATTEIVLDHDNRAAFGDLPHEVDDARQIFTAYARHRLVEQQNLGFKCERRRDLELALAAIGEFARESRAKLT
jgi:hypothetical protein